MLEKQSAVDPIAPLSNQVAVVTGAARGIGEAIALKLARMGAAVVLTARDQARLAQVKADIEQARRKSLRAALRLDRRESRRGFRGAGRRRNMADVTFW